MIPADILLALTGLTHTDLMSILASCKVKGCKFDSAEFLGLSPGGLFVYGATQSVVGSDEPEQIKVFVVYSFAEDKISANID